MGGYFSGSTPPGRPGYVYVLTNSAMPGIVKIGRTFRAPRTRLRELSDATGVPVEFELAWAHATFFSVELEHAVHRALRDKRVNHRREFFAVSPEEARSVILAHDPRPSSRSPALLAWPARIALAAACAAPALLALGVNPNEFWPAAAVSVPWTVVVLGVRRAFFGGPRTPPMSPEAWRAMREQDALVSRN